MFRGDGQSVEEYEEDDQPIENLRFHRRPALPPAQPVPPPRVAAERGRRGGEELWERGTKDGGKVREGRRVKGEGGWRD